MAIIGFNYTKIHIEKNEGISGNVKITNNVSVKDIIETDFNFGSQKQKGLKFMFEYTTEYNPEIGKLSISGEVMTLEPDEHRKKIIDEWKKNKSVQNSVMVAILNHIFNKCNLQALILTRDVNLPPPIKLPELKPAVAEKPKK
jgi:hypothetical protein